MRSTRVLQNRLSLKLGVLGKVRLHPLLLGLVALAVGVGLWKSVVVLFLLVMLHELGHAAVAEYLGYEVEEVSLLPFGGVAKMSLGNIGFMPRHEAFIAIAGPVVNFLLIFVSYILWLTHFWSHSFFLTVVHMNLWIALFNLLPAMPLDGGRILRAARSRSIGFETATVEAYRLGLSLGLVLLVLGVVAIWAGYAHVGLIILAVFLLFSSWMGIRGLRMETVRFLDAKRRQNGGIDEVRLLAVNEMSTVRDVVRRFGPNRYHVVYVLNDKGSIIDEIEEDELLSAVFAGRWLSTLGEVRS
ncbi:site-2 protease family protein [Alicyclobacillus sp. SO9]|uniref:site-2 protease family protein n=1 Tax=Alicyclobacillus sp. SO9 TaxID=2665646 RepID=UPI0018E77CB9|nr:site-2 protease family protein [Alicyclobacillus sp. SO9]QQE77002.1 peptidase M50 [Alicyclobacillus sp. SO9]